MTQDNNLEAAPSESHEDENEYDSESFEYGDEGVSGEEAGSPGSLTEVIYVRGGVSIRPTPSSHIKGRLSLVRQDRVLFIAWLPSALRHRKARAPASPSPVGEKAEGELGASPAAGSPENKEAYDRSLYAVHPIPLSDVRAVRPHTPPLRQHTVTLVLHSGLTMPPFYFLQGGVKTFLSVLKQHVNLLPSADTPGAFLVNDLADPLQRSLTSLQLADALPAPMVRQRDGAPSWPLAQWQLEEVSSDGDDAPGVREQLRELVDKFQKVAQGAKDAASSFLAGSVMLGGAPLSEHLAQVGRATVAAAGGDVDVEISENDAHDSIGVSQREASPFLSGEDVGGPIAVPEPRSPSADGEGASLATSPSFASAGWELIDRSVSSELAASPVWAHPRPPPLTSEELAAMIDSEGRLIDQAGLRTRAFYGGIDPPARPQVWKWLLGVDGLDSSAAQREAAVVERRERYVALRRQWESIGADQASRFGKWRERKSRVDKDVHRTDRKHRFFAKERGQAARMLRNVLLAHVMWNFDLGYVQGMSDLAAPLLWVARTEVGHPGQLSAEERTAVEAEAFWMFAALMERMAGNFNSDCVGMHAQLEAASRLLSILDPPLYAHLARHDALNLFFCYRWVLILFKREFPFDQVLRLWEALWARPADHLHLYLSVAVLSRQRRRIIEENLDFDGLLKLCVEIPGTINLEQALADAEMLKECAGEAGEIVVAGLVP